MGVVRFRRNSPAGPLVYAEAIQDEFSSSPLVPTDFAPAGRCRLVRWPCLEDRSRPHSSIAGGGFFKVQRVPRSIARGQDRRQRVGDSLPAMSGAEPWIGS